MVFDVIKKVRIASLYALAVFPVLLPHLISLAAIFFIITTIALLIEERDLTFDVKKFTVISLPFFIYLFALLYSDHLGDGLTVVQKKLLLIVLPLGLGFHATTLTEKLKGRLFLTFELAAAAIAIYTNLMIRMVGLVQKGDLTDITFLYRESIALYSNMHPTYYCAILFWAAFMSINNLFRDWHKKRSTPVVWLELILSAILVTSALAGAARAPMIAFGVIIIGWIFMKCRNAGKPWVAYLISIAIVASVLSVPAMRDRLREINIANFSAPTQGNDNGTNVRSGIFICNYDLLKEHWLTGVGTGDVQYELNDCFNKYQTDVYDKHDFNSHNEYFNALFTAGVLGLAVLLTSLALSFLSARRAKHYTHIFFLVFMCICFFTENYLERQSGVMLFAWFQSLFFFSHKESERA